MIEVQVFSPDGTTMLAILDGASNVQWTDMLGDVGSGSCQLSIYDPKYTAQNVAKGNLVKFVLNGTAVFAFYLWAPKLSVGEAETSLVTLAGNGVLDYLSNGLAYPPGWSGSGTYPSNWTWAGVTPGYVLATLIAAAQVRGTIPVLRYSSFSPTLDSLGHSWTANVNLTVDAKATILDVAKKLIALGIGIYVDPNLNLYAYTPGAQGANVSSTVIFQTGRHLIAPVDNVGSKPSTVVLAAGVTGSFVETSDPNYTGNPAYGRIETAIDYSTVTGDTTQLTTAGNAQIALSENAGQAITIKVNHGTGGLYEPYVDYHLGDTVAINVPGSYSNAPSQVVGITVVETPNADYETSVNLGSIALPIELRLARMLASTSGTTSNVSGGVQGNLTLCNPRGFPSGTAFPLNPTTGYAFFRTDLGEWYYYDGTRWLGPKTWLALDPQTPQGGSFWLFTVSTADAFMSALPPQSLLVDFSQTVIYDTSANNYPMYWQLVYYTPGAQTATVEFTISGGVVQN